MRLAEGGGVGVEMKLLMWGEVVLGIEWTSNRRTGNSEGMCFLLVPM
jgi:hypothetical protein